MRRDSLDSRVDLIEHVLIEVASAVHFLQVPLEILPGHGHGVLAHVMVVLVHVQHNDGVRQGERGVSVSERLVVRFLPAGGDGGEQ